jgi:hypothetical protein
LVAASSRCALTVKSENSERTISPQLLFFHKSDCGDFYDGVRAGGSGISYVFM